MKILRVERRRLKIFELRALRHITIASCEIAMAEKLLFSAIRDLNVALDAFIVAHAARQKADRHVQKAVFAAGRFGPTHARAMAKSINTWHQNRDFYQMKTSMRETAIVSLTDVAIVKLKAAAVIDKIVQTAGDDHVFDTKGFKFDARKSYLDAQKSLFDVAVNVVEKNVMHYFLVSQIEKLIPYVSSEDQYIFVSFYRKSISSILRRIKNK